VCDEEDMYTEHIPSARCVSRTWAGNYCNPHYCCPGSGCSRRDARCATTRAESIEECSGGRGKLVQPTKVPASALDTSSRVEVANVVREHPPISFFARLHIRRKHWQWGSALSGHQTAVSPNLLSCAARCGTVNARSSVTGISYIKVGMSNINRHVVHDCSLIH
jgi:hypothetical protein